MRHYLMFGNLYKKKNSPEYFQFFTFISCIHVSQFFLFTLNYEWWTGYYQFFKQFVQNFITFSVLYFNTLHNYITHLYIFCFAIMICQKKSSQEAIVSIFPTEVSI